MMKYDFDLDLSSKNSVSLIISKIKYGSTVLEFGPAAGRMTRYLKEEKGCTVYIVEIDEDAGKKASVYAEEAVIGNIEDFTWFDKFKNIRFDHIIFADVLEHLYNPQLVLKKCAELINENGTLLTSVPNIAHNSVIIDLLHNKFEYRKTGLLDDTHIRFFTYNSLKEMMHSCNLEVNWEDVIIKSVGHTEFENYFDDIPRDVAKYLKNRPLGDIYQFVLELKSQSEYPESSTKRSNIVTNGEYYFSQLYLDCGDGFTENQSVRIRTTNNIEYYLFDTTGFENIKSLRLDPLNTNCLLKIRNISYLDMNNVEHIINDFSSNAEYVSDDIYLFDNDDPQIFFNPICDEMQEVRINFSIINYETENETWFLKVLNEKKTQSEILGDEQSLIIDHLKSEIEEGKERSLLKEQEWIQENDAFKVELNRLQDEIKNINEALNNKEELLSSKDNVLKSKDELLKSKTVEMDNANEKIKSLEMELSKIYSTRFWTTYSKIFKKND